MVVSRACLFVDYPGWPASCSRITAEPAKKDSDGRFILEKPGVWHLYALTFDNGTRRTVRAYLIWEEDGTWTLLGLQRHYFEVSPEGTCLVVSISEYPLGCYRILEVEYAQRDNLGRFIIDKPGAWEISAIEGYNVYETRLCVYEDGTWDFVDEAEGFTILTA